MQFYNDNKAAILMYLDNNEIIKKKISRASDRSLSLTQSRFSVERSLALRTIKFQFLTEA